VLGQARAPEQASAGLMSYSSLPHAIHKECIAGHSKAVNFAGLEKKIGAAAQKARQKQAFLVHPRPPHSC